MNLEVKQDFSSSVFFGLFYCLYNTHTHTKNRIVNDYHESCDCAMWNILENEMFCTKKKEEVLDILLSIVIRVI